MTHIMLMLTVLVGANGHFAGPAGPGSEDPLLRAAIHLPLQQHFCAKCKCCDDMCNTIGGNELFENGVVEAGYCPNGCPIDPVCAEPEFAALLGGHTLEDALAESWATAGHQSATELVSLLSRYPQVVLVNVERSALQVRGCGGSIVAHVPLPAGLATTVMEELGMTGS